MTTAQRTSTVRKPVTNSCVPIGQKLSADVAPSFAGTQDAFHVPAIFVTSPVGIRHGQYVKFTSDSTVVPCEKEEHQAVADPWFKKGAGFNPGTGFWALIRPGLVKSMTHVFETDSLLPGDANERTD